MKAIEIFQYLRGAVRSAYGIEDFRGKSILFLGMGNLGQELLLRLCLEEVSLFFDDSKISNYYHAHTVCDEVFSYKGEPIDITLDLENQILIINGRQNSLSQLGQEPYTKGIHDFYL